VLWRGGSEFAVEVSMTLWLVKEMVREFVNAGDMGIGMSRMQQVNVA
jgi:hypothetical protein